jgi:hypothetical protein
MTIFSTNNFGAHNLLTSDTAVGPGLFLHPAQCHFACTILLTDSSAHLHLKVVFVDPYLTNTVLKLTLLHFDKIFEPITATFSGDSTFFPSKSTVKYTWQIRNTPANMCI